MSGDGVVARYRQQWQEMDPRFKYAIAAIALCGAILVMVRAQDNERVHRDEQDRKLASAALKANAESGRGLPNGGNTFSALPASSRNQGLEDLLASLDKARLDARQAQEHSKDLDEQVRRLAERMNQFEGRAGATSYGSAPAAATTEGTRPAYENLPPPVDFGQSEGAPGNRSAQGRPSGDPPIPAEPARPEASRIALHVWADEAQPEPVRRAADAAPPLTIPANSAIESVMLSGINARSNSAGGAASGTILSANNVGAPFVTRVKGNAILPNGWKVPDFDDCFISGTGIAILSSERANVISNVISCVDRQGNVYEARIKAYGVDLDGIQGIAGRVVTKQGSLLAKTALAGVASGLGSAFAPTALPSYNQNAKSGDRQGIEYPNPGLIAGSALGGGINEAGRALARFYLDYAKEMFPVIEVNAGTRITWILQETVELNRIRSAKR